MGMGMGMGMGMALLLMNSSPLLSWPPPSLLADAGVGTSSAYGEDEGTGTELVARHSSRGSSSVGSGDPRASYGEAITGQAHPRHGFSHGRLPTLTEEEEGADRSGLGMDLDLDLDVDLMADLDLMQAGLRQLVICCALYERQRSATLARLATTQATLAITQAAALSAPTGSTVAAAAAAAAISPPCTEVLPPPFPQSEQAAWDMAGVLVSPSEAQGVLVSASVLATSATVLAIRAQPRQASSMQVR